MSGAVDRARWDELMKDQTAAALAAGILATAPEPASIDDAVILMRIVRRKLYPAEARQ